MFSVNLSYTVRVMLGETPVSQNNKQKDTDGNIDEMRCGLRRIGQDPLGREASAAYEQLQKAQSKGWWDRPVIPALRELRQEDQSSRPTWIHSSFQEGRKGGREGEGDQHRD